MFIALLMASTNKVDAKNAMDTHLKIMIYVDESAKNKALDAFFRLIAPVRSRPGCLEVCVFEEPRGSNRIHFWCQWDCDATLKGFVRSPVFDKALEILESSKKVPTLIIESPEGRGGLEFVERIRRTGII